LSACKSCQLSFPLQVLAMANPSRMRRIRWLEPLTTLGGLWALRLLSLFLQSSSCTFTGCAVDG